MATITYMGKKFEGFDEVITRTEENGLNLYTNNHQYIDISDATYIDIEGNVTDVNVDFNAIILGDIKLATAKMGIYNEGTIKVVQKGQTVEVNKDIRVVYGKDFMLQQELNSSLKCLDSLRHAQQRRNQKQKIVHIQGNLKSIKAEFTNSKYIVVHGNVKSASSDFNLYVKGSVQSFNCLRVYSTMGKVPSRDYGKIFEAELSRMEKSYKQFSDGLDTVFDSAKMSINMPFTSRGATPQPRKFV